MAFLGSLLVVCVIWVAAFVLIAGPMLFFQWLDENLPPSKPSKPPHPPVEWM